MIDNRRESCAYLTGLFTGLSVWKIWFVIPAIIFLILSGVTKDAKCVTQEKSD